MPIHGGNCHSISTFGQHEDYRFLKSPSSLSLEFKLNIQLGQAKAPVPLPLATESTASTKQTEDVSEVKVQAAETIEPIESLKYVIKHAKILKNTVKHIKEYKCKHIVMVDHELFNIFAARAIRKEFGNTVKIYYYIPPRVSMWGAKSASSSVPGLAHPRAV